MARIKHAVVGTDGVPTGKFYVVEEKLVVEQGRIVTKKNGWVEYYNGPY